MFLKQLSRLHAVAPTALNKAGAIKCIRKHTSGIAPSKFRRVFTPFDVDTNQVSPRALKCQAVCTSEAYDISGLRQYLSRQPEFEVFDVLGDRSALYLKYLAPETDQECFFFKDGSLVAWNLPASDFNKIVGIAKNHGSDNFVSLAPKHIETCVYEVTNDPAHGPSRVQTDSPVHFIINTSLPAPSDEQINPQKFTISHALSLSAKLDIREAMMDTLLRDIEHIPRELKQASKFKVTERQALQRIGAIQELRCQILLQSDALSVPDLYWEKPDLEKLYVDMTSKMLDVPDRVETLRNKIEVATDLTKMVHALISEKRSSRVEVMIMLLVAVEVVFEASRLANSAVAHALNH